MTIQKLIQRTGMAVGVCALMTTAFAQQPGVTLSGRVTTSDGLPVQADLLVVTGGKDVQILSFRTDPQGNYSIQVPDPGAKGLPVVAKAGGYLSDEKVLTAGNAGGALDFSLVKAEKATCRVTDENGQGIANATVSVHYPGRHARSLEFTHELGKLKTDGYGYVTLPLVGRGTPVRVLAATDDLPLSSSGILTLGGATEPSCQVKMTRKGQVVRGKVTRSDGSPASGVLVRVRATGNRESFSADERESIAFIEANNKSARTGPDGSYVIRGVPQGTVVVLAQQGAARSSGTREAAGAAQPVDVDLALP